MQDWTPDELKEHLTMGAPIFLKLWKKGCGACKLSIPALERIEADAEFASLTCGQINVDDYDEMLAIAETDVLPAFFVFQNQKMAGKFIGFKGLEKLKGFIKESLNPQESSEEGE